MPPRPRPLAFHTLLLAFYLGLILVLSWPLVLKFSTHVPGDGVDDPSLAWNLWWIKFQLVDQLNFDIFHAGWMYYPISVNLGYYTLTPLNGLIGIPLQSASTLVISNNILMLSSFVLGAYGAFLLSLEVLGTTRASPIAANADKAGEYSAYRYGPTAPATIASILASLVYAFASSKLFYVSLGQFNIASSQWIPFCLLYVWRMGHRTTLRAARRDALMAALFLTFQAWSELTYASFLLIFIALFLLWRLILIFQDRRPNRRSRLASIMWGSVVLGTGSLLGITPFLWAMIPDMLSEGDFFGHGGGFADVFSADLMGYLVPTQLHPLLGTVAAALPFAGDKGQHIYVGYTIALVIAAGWIARNRDPGVDESSTSRAGAVFFWLLCALLFWTLTLGPHVRWAGQDTPIPGPFALISKLPFFSGNRYPSRYSVMLMASVAVLMAYALNRLLSAPYLLSTRGKQSAGISAARQRDGRRLLPTAALGIIVAALFLLEHLSVPLPLSDFRIPNIYQTIAAEPGDFAILELPTGWRNGARIMGKSDVLIMIQQWYQTMHGKRRLGGNTSRSPEYKFQYFTDAPLLGDLIALMNADRDHIRAVIEPQFQTIVERNRRYAAGVLSFLGIRLVIVHVEKSPQALLRFVEEALPLDLVDEWSGDDWSGAPSTIRLYRVQNGLRDTNWEANVASPEGALYLAEGWSSLASDQSDVRYATRKSARLLLDLPQEGGKLRVETFGPTLPLLLLNDTPLETNLSEEDGTWVEASVPAGLARELVDQLTLLFAGPMLPVTATIPAPLDGKWAIGATGAELDHPMALAVRSAGEEVGDFAYIYVNGRNVAANERGYNLVALDSNGNILDAAVFDTLDSNAESGSMAAWLGSWPAGTIIAGAVADEASLNLGQDAVDALAGVGVEGDLRGKFRWSHAFIGATGAAPGTALESISLIRPASLYIGSPVDAPFVSGGVGRVEFIGTE